MNANRVICDSYRNLLLNRYNSIEMYFFVTMRYQQVKFNMETTLISLEAIIMMFFHNVITAITGKAEK